MCFYSSVHMRKEQELTFDWGEWAHANVIDCTKSWDPAPETKLKMNGVEKSIQQLLKFQREFTLIKVLLTLHEIGLFQEVQGRFHYIYRINGRGFSINNYIWTDKLKQSKQQSEKCRASSRGGPIL